MPRFGADLDKIVHQWRRERPDLAADCMAVCGAIWQAGRRLTAGLQKNLDKYGLDFAGMDVLLTLRRNGKDNAMSPKDMAADMMMSGSAMTARLDKLEKRGLIARHPDPADRRGLRIALTDEGFALADDLVVGHVAAEEHMLSKLSRNERDQLRLLLSKVALN